MVNVGLGTGPSTPIARAARAGQHAFARAHFARQQHHVARTHASAQALAKALHVFFGLTKDFQQMTHLLPQWGTTERCLLPPPRT